MAKVHDLGFELLLYLSYSSDWAPSVSFLSLNLKIWLGGKRFSSNEEVIAALDEYFKGYETSYFSEEIRKLEDNWTMCLEGERDYVKNKR